MKITVLGTGNMGSALVTQFARAGHSMRVVGRDLAKARALANAHPSTVAVNAFDAARESDVIIVATSYADAAPALQAVGDLNSKIVIDITNPLTTDYMSLAIGHNTSGAEEIARTIPNAHVVKAFNTVFAQVLSDGALFADGQRGSVFFAGDDTRAKDTVKVLIESIGFLAVDAGSLRNARYLEPLAGLNIYFGYGAGMGTTIAPAWIAKS
ncbi:NADPH-dependent F420 reductase [Burkholderia lata]|uniref:NADPH-dependent F420 reductase n=1 Tax=Burkholderia lata (strain ATCC 17760 / DSM 23089 / LMG 22485 / NCIMB 9086 / R18194 / 383) TaxID=482957 RepID=UPI0014538C18|nr:NAD(P)-binding domain-containing protein [Burkholderia lata]VWB44214.1 Pyrroline-5-carboxylate reductase [Burkholderia lata]